MLKKDRVLGKLLLTVLIFVSFSCREQSSKIFDAAGETETVRWTPEELARDIAVKRIRRNAGSSYHLIRLRGKESPHTHEEHDLVVFMLKGKARVYLKDRWLEMKRGDIIEVPRGVLHWAENAAREPSEVYAVFSPPLDAPDTVPKLFTDKEAGDPS